MALQMEAPAEPHEPPPISPAPASPPAARPRRWGRWLAQRGSELVTVFMGVYLAFLLNAYQLRQQERQRRTQLLNWLAGYYGKESASLKNEAAHLKAEADLFKSQLTAGEMPPLHAFNLRTGYSPTDISGLLQSGGYDLLDMDAVRAIREAEGTLRGLVMLAEHDQALSDSFILPNLGKGQEVFYDPATRQLRPNYAWYPQFYDAALSDYDDLQKQVAELLDRIKDQQARNR